MKSKVYFCPVSQGHSVQDISDKLAGLLIASRILDFVRSKSRVALKIHFGEEGNTGFVRPEYAGIIASALRGKGAEPFLSDTNTLYKGRRTNSEDHKKLAYEHGFTTEACNAPVVITDDTKRENVAEIPLGGKFIKTAKIARVFSEADAIVGIAHFKGHIMTGFGGALKNIGMGCATREGKLAQHSDISPYVDEGRCASCEACVNACPADAIFIKHDKARIDRDKCIGCATCIAVCPETAIEVDWESGGDIIQEKMAEYANAVLKDKRCAFINFATKITAECDCLAKDDPRIAPDVGIFASRDPVAIDKACLDIIVKAAGRNIFAEAHPKRDGLSQLKYAAELEMGSFDYELITL